ncbi:MAG: cytidylate kinase-like family protein, partial [Pirellulales bacterium]|nr:cytidylate kinase-like family protein [Pirellulales bacterium]
ARGECVIVGRGAGFRLPPKTTFRVALVAPAKDRVGRIAEEQQISENEAGNLVKKVDHDRHAFVKDHFHKDPRDMEHYDLVLNTSTFSTSDCARLIIDAYRSASDQQDANAT